MLDYGLTIRAMKDLKDILPQDEFIPTEDDYPSDEVDWDAVDELMTEMKLLGMWGTK